MKLHSRFLTVLVAAISLPAVALAAKGEKKSNTPNDLYDAMDKDGNGVVTQAEYIASVKERLGEDGAKTRFAEMDKNKDGKLSKEEFGGTSAEPNKKRGGGKKKKT